MNLLTTVLNATPVIPTELEEGELEVGEVGRDTPQCVAFGLFMIWFSSITINLGPTFLSGALAANADLHIDEPSCPLVQVMASQGEGIFISSLYICYRVRTGTTSSTCSGS